MKTSRAIPSACATFSARVLAGAGRGRTIGSPTLNLDLTQVPKMLKHGIYACTVTWNRKTHPAAVHFGPRPVFKAGITCEVHVIDHVIRRAPATVRVRIMKKLRTIRDFASVQALQRQIVRDIAQSRGILNAP